MNTSSNDPRTSIPTGRLENWKVAVRTPDGYTLFGTMFGDALQRFPDGVKVHTSLVHDTLKDPQAGDIVQTENNTYELGAPALAH
jgi:hypothetical protein